MKNKKLEAVGISVLIGLVSYGVLYGVCYAVEYASMSVFRTEEQCRELTGVIGDSPEDDEQLDRYPEMRGVTRSDSCLEGIKELKQNFLGLRIIFPLLGGLFIPLTMSWIVWPSKDDDELQPKTKKCFCGQMIEEFRIHCGKDQCYKQYQNIEEKKTAPFFPYYTIIAVGFILAIGSVISGFWWQTELQGYIALVGLALGLFGQIPRYLKERELRAKYSGMVNGSGNQ